MFAKARNLSPLACFAEWALALRTPTATGRTATALTCVRRSSTVRALMSSIALSAVLTNLFEKHAIACVVAWLVGMLLPLRNHSHCLRKSAH